MNCKNSECEMSYIKKRNKDLGIFLNANTKIKKVIFYILGFLFYFISIPFLFFWYLCPLLKINTKKRFFTVAFFVMWGLLFIPIKIGLSSTQNSAIDVLIGSLIMSLCIVSIPYSIGYYLLSIVKRKRNKKQIKENLKKEGILIRAELKHVNGLPIPENTFCRIDVYEDKYEFLANGLNIKLEKNKLTDVSIKSDIAIQQQAVSSIGGAIAGNLLLGPLGAIIGGRVKTKAVKTITNYLILTYVSEEEIKYIGFETGAGLEALKIEKDYKDSTKQKEIKKLEL